jgi:hypothetical protein
MLFILIDHYMRLPTGTGIPFGREPGSTREFKLIDAPYRTLYYLVGSARALRTPQRTRVLRAD